MNQPQVVLLTITADGEDLQSVSMPSPPDNLAFVQYSVAGASAGHCLTQLWGESFAAIILDCRIPSPDELLATMRQLTQAADSPGPVMIVLGENDAQLAVQAIKAGASDYWVRDRVTPQQWTAALSSRATQPQQASSPYVTQRKHLETAAKIHADQFHLVTQTIQDVFWIADFRIPKVLYVSPAYAEIWGRSPTEVYQDYSLWAETIHPDDRQRVLSTAAVAGEQDTVEQEYRIVRPDGSLRWIRDRGFAVRNDAGEFQQMVGIAQDITERKQAVAALADNEARLRGFVDSNVVGILYGDIHGNIFQANDELLRIVGYTRADLAAGQLRWIAMTPPEYLPLDEQRIAEAQARGACTPYEKEYIHKDGKRVPVLIGYSLVGERRKESVVFVLDLSDRKKAERALRRSEDRLRIALESARLGTWDWNLVKDKLVWNDRCKAMFGLSPQASITMDTFFQALHPEDRDRLQQYVQGCMNPANGGHYDVEYRTIGIEDGIERWILAKGQVYFSTTGTPTRFIGTVLNITEEKQAEIDLRESRERLQMALDGSGSGFWDWNITTNEDYLSPEWLHMLGFAAGELPAEYGSWEKLIHPEDKAMAIGKLHAHLQDSANPYEFEYRLRTKAGDWKWIASYGKIVKRDAAGQPVRMAGIHLDISERKQAEAEREHLLKREQAARAEAERANRVKDEFLAVLSHELRSPLNPILGWAQLMQTKTLDAAKTRQALQTIERNAKLQTQLIDDLLDIAKILRGKLKLDHAPVDLAAVINAALETVTTAATAKSISIQPCLQTVGPVWGDGARLQQIVWNLISNAIKFTPAQGQVTIALQSAGDHAQILVSDTGKGIQPDFLPYIFESFRQEDISITREHGGLGLGLAIVRYLTEAHGGEIAASSPGLGQGATFTVSLPLMAQAATALNEYAPTSATLSLAGIRVLAADDDPDCRALIATMLQEYDAEVLTVASAQEALAEVLKFQPDILISDLGMPHFDGYHLIKQVRSLSEKSGGQIPAIALTAYTREEDQQKSLAQGFHRHMAKPLEVDVLVRTIYELVRPTAIP
jgi:PAS domain S-box-containing protein